VGALLIKIMSYHLRPIIIKGKYGDLSKVYEELDELSESLKQNNRILALVELSDLYGAIEAFAETLGTNIVEIAKMSEATKRSFKSGERK